MAAVPNRPAAGAAVGMKGQHPGNASRSAVAAHRMSPIAQALATVPLERPAATASLMQTHRKVRNRASEIETVRGRSAGSVWPAANLAAGRCVVLAERTEH